MTLTIVPRHSTSSILEKMKSHLDSQSITDNVDAMRNKKTSSDAIVSTLVDIAWNTYGKLANKAQVAEIGPKIKSYCEGKV